MIKRILPAILLVVAASVAGALMFLQRLPSPSSHPPASAGWLPENVTAYFQLWNVTGTLERIRETDLAALLAEPAVQKFTAQWTDGSGRLKRFQTALQRVEAMRVREAFVAFTNLNPPVPTFVAGFQAHAGAEAIDEVLERPADELRAWFPAGTADVQRAGRFVFDVFKDGKFELYVCREQDWCFIATDPELLHTVVDRRYRNSVKGSLLTSRTFKTATGPLPENRESLIYVNAGPLIENVLALLDFQGVAVPEEDAASLRRLSAFGASTSIERGGFRDAMFFAAKEPQTVGEKLRRSTLGVGSADTLFFMATKLPPKATAETGPIPAPGIEELGPLAPAYQALLDAGVSLPDIGNSFGAEISVGYDWPQSGAPQAYVAAETGDRELLAKVLQRFANATPGARFLEAPTAAGPGPGSGTARPGPDQTPVLGLDVSLDELGRQLGVPLTIPQLEIRVHEDVAVAGIGDIEGIVARLGSGEKDQWLENQDRFREAAWHAGDADDVFGYLDLGRLLSQTTAALRPMLMVLSALAPQLSQMVDLRHLPPNELYAKHLRPLTFVQSNRRDGVLVQSTGSVTLAQLTLAAGAVAVGASLPRIEELWSDGTMMDMIESLGTKGSAGP